MKKPSVKTKKGRPAGADTENVRALLLDAARKQFSVREFKGVSIKTIAEAAGVNGAMVHYYFGDKRGLYLTMVEQIFAPMIENLTLLEDSHYHSIEGFIKSYMALLAENPWWPNFVIREVLFGEEEFRLLIISRIRDHLAPGLLKLIQQEREDGHFRDDLEPRFALLSLMSMTIFPFLARPLLESALEIRVNEGAVDALSEHTCKLFLSGVIANDSKTPIMTVKE
ncbi:MAG: TetR/AcrR family transcriptional regulator [Gammaproteobacteria bacterium]|nr:TetR/AcrR family transcriptional regulator [Gammaproteobacteria bacterium]MDP2142238.1 TetR/AcrR family transcriptional regulator [Gammaproteobacteria bacterium]MDP2347887.1 TetR/AcrR family transcriptional regulator [Gammaproteobacteria bacterium]